MTIQRAEQLVQCLQDLIADESKRGARRSPSLLPAPKPECLQAIKLVIAQLYLIGADDERRVDPLLRAAMILDSFTDAPLGVTEFVGAMADRRKEIADFRESLGMISRNHTFFWQRVYPLAGVETQTQKGTIMERLHQRIRGRSNPLSSDQPPSRPAYDYAAGRYDLDVT